MKLSRALLIVLLLHVVAVAGIIAFNTIKTREALGPVTVDPAVTPASSPVAVTSENETSSPNEITQVAAESEANVPSKPLTTAKGSNLVKTSESPKSVAKSSSIPDSGKIYTVMKGDNPVTIARRLHVNYDALLELNQISDPRKLQIGQKLHIPKRELAAKSHSD